MYKKPKKKAKKKKKSGLKRRGLSILDDEAKNRGRKASR